MSATLETTLARQLLAEASTNRLGWYIHHGGEHAAIAEEILAGRTFYRVEVQQDNPDTPYAATLVELFDTRGAALDSQRAWIAGYLRRHHADRIDVWVSRHEPGSQTTLGPSAFTPVMHETAGR